MQTQSVTQGSLQTREGRSLPLERTDVRASVTGAVADVSVTQVFRNDGTEPIEAIYLFPLPHEASVHRMLFRIADRVVHGVVKEKAEARAAYERAKSEGRAATLLEEDAPAIFTLSVANVAPGVTITVELGYQEVLAYDDGRWRFVFPMVAPERYRDAPAANNALLAGPRVPTHERAPDVSVEVMVRGDGGVEELKCPSHRTRTRHTDDGVPIVTLDAGEAIPNKDFVLTWRAGDTGVRPWLRFERAAETEPGTFLLMLTPSVPRTHTELAGGHGDLKAVRCGNCGGVIHDLSSIKEIPGLGPVVPCAFCGAILAPGTEVITRATRPRDVLILVDRSASMRGSMPMVRRAVRVLLDNLGPGDGAQLMAFDHDRVAFDGDGERFAVISPELVQMAERFLAPLTPRGGTEMEEALERASKVPAREGRTRAVVLITDAAVGNEGRLLRRVPELLGKSTRLFVLGVGSAVERRLVEKLARVGGGASDVVLPTEGDDETLVRFARRVREGGAVLTNLTLYWEGAEIVDVYPKSLPDLFGGEPVRVLGRFTHTGMTKLIITAATADGKPYRQELEIGLPGRTERSPGFTRLWAQRRVQDLAERANAGAPDAAALRAEGTALSLAHRIVGPFTSLVAEDSEVAVTQPPKPVKVQPMAHARGRAERTRDGVVEASAELSLDEHVESALYEGSAPLEADMFDDASASVTGAGFAAGGAPGAAPFAAPAPRAMPAPAMAAPAMPAPAAPARASAPLGPMPAMPAPAMPPLGAAPPQARARRVTDDGAAGPFEPPVAPASAAYIPPPSESFGGPPSMPMRSAPKSRGGGGFFSKIVDAITGGSSDREEESYVDPRSGVKHAAPPPVPPPAPPPVVVAPPIAGMPTRTCPACNAACGAERFCLICGKDLAPPPVAPKPPVAPMPPPNLMPPPNVFPPPTNMPMVPRPHAHTEPSLPGSEPYSESELQWFAARNRGELDLVFLVDETGSMGSYIAQVRKHLLALVAELKASPLCRMLRLGIVSYRDHPPQDHTYASKVVALTDDIEKIRREVEKLSASGGGDGPESVTDGLYDLVRLDWRPTAARAVVWFGDAPPHGVEPHGDAFPKGCPCGHHWYTQAESCREMGVAVYAIGCLPGLRSFAGAEAVFQKVAETTHGVYLPLHDAALLVPMIVGAASSELDRQRVDEHVADLVREAGPTFAQTTDVERVRWLTEALRHKGIRVREMAAPPDARRVSPLRFRDVAPGDVSGSLGRLRYQDRIGA